MRHLQNSCLIALLAFSLITTSVHADQVVEQSVARDLPQPATKEPAEETLHGPHGGVLTCLQGIQIETVVEPNGVRLFAYNAEQQPLDLRDARGLISLQVHGESKRFRFDMFPEIEKDQSAYSLATLTDLSRWGGRHAEVRIDVTGLLSNSKKQERLSVKTQIPMTEDQQIAAAIKAQGVCPVSKQPLGSMGKPISVTVDGVTIYVCCDGCIDKVKSNPDIYFIKQQKLVISKSTAADAEAISLQKVCPVMDEPLGSMGTPIKVTGLGRDVFLCCKGCLKLLEKEPQKYLAKLPPLPHPTVTKATTADAKFVAAQKLCPVMDKPLDAMGGPFKTTVDGKSVYICCPGCANKLHASPKQYIEKLAQQGVKPPLEQ